MPEASSLKKTPLHDLHVSLGARMVPFAGFDMPVQYDSIIDEHMAVRTTAGLFDVSHMGEVLVQGPAAFDFVQHLVTNDAAKLYDGRAMYSAMCKPNGGIVDDLLVYRLRETGYMLVINASNIDGDYAWMQENNPMAATLSNISDQVALLAIQGPNSFDIVQSLSSDVCLEEIKYYHFVQMKPGSFLGCDHAILSHTGYTGEKGLEIYCDASKAEEVCHALLAAGSSRGLRPAGLGARDTLRLEAGFSLYGNDISLDTNPLEAGLGWITKLDKGDFVGREALLRIKSTGTKRKLVGFVVEGRGIARHGHAIHNSEGQKIGEVTSGSPSPVLGKGVGLCYVENNPAYTTQGKAITISAGKRKMTARITKPPFHKK